MEQIRTAVPQAKVLLISPIYLGDDVWKEGYDQEFSQRSVIVSQELEQVYEQIATERNIGFLKASSYVGCCEADQEHLNAQGHRMFADAVYDGLQQIAV